ncbi:ubiquitin family protein [Flagelloscypha sp. PMI_526]|nr:ubiquitin family protein [Flagelloscypha sp. PMI_526]
MAEQAFIRTYLSTISSQPIQFSDDYQHPPQAGFKRGVIGSISVTPPPSKKQKTSSSEDKLEVTFKSAKPSLSLVQHVALTDSVLEIKHALHKLQAQTVPPPEFQRLLIKGKVLADNKLLKDYQDLIEKENKALTVNLVVRPGWNPSTATATTTVAPTPVPAPASMNNLSLGEPPVGGAKKKHARIPSVVLSPSPDSSTTDVSGIAVSGTPTIEKDIVLNLDAIDDSGRMSPTGRSEETSYRLTIADPEFWKKLHIFLGAEFKTEHDAVQAFETFLRSAKQTLTAGEIAKIRDVVGIVGMAGR